jgi:hypothetical protein
MARFVRFVIGIAVGAPDSGITSKFFFDPKPARRLDIASTENARASMTMSTQSA